jgi:hypothetical protein
MGGCESRLGVFSVFPGVEFTMRLYFVAWMVVLASSVSARPAGAEDNFSTLVRPGPDGRLAYQADAKGNVIPDFSNCGYMGGGVTIPNVPVKATLAPEASGDDTDRIQKAIDTLGKLPSDSAGLRGTLLLKKGRYRVEGQLKITAGGVVLRGEGQGEDGTIVIATGKDKRHLVVAETPKDTARAPRLDEAKQAIVDAYVPVGARSFRVADASAYKPGDTVYVSREGNAEWIHAIHMDQIKPIGADRKLVQWTAFTLQFDRVVTAVNGNRITVDAPLACAIDAKWGGGGIRKFRDGRIGQIGVENIRFESDYDASKTAAKSGSKLLGAQTDGGAFFRRPGERGRRHQVDDGAGLLRPGHGVGDYGRQALSVLHRRRTAHPRAAVLLPRRPPCLFVWSSGVRAERLSGLHERTESREQRAASPLVRRRTLRQREGPHGRRGSRRDGQRTRLVGRELRDLERRGLALVRTAAHGAELRHRVCRKKDRRPQQAGRRALGIAGQTRRAPQPLPQAARRSPRHAGREEHRTVESACPRGRLAKASTINAGS